MLGTCRSRIHSLGTLRLQRKRAQKKKTPKSNHHRGHHLADNVHHQRFKLSKTKAIHPEPIHLMLRINQLY